jgi:hypothetical protein
VELGALAAPPGSASRHPDCPILLAVSDNLGGRIHPQRDPAIDPGGFRVWTWTGSSRRVNNLWDAYGDLVLVGVAALVVLAICSVVVRVQRWVPVNRLVALVAVGPTLVWTSHGVWNVTVNALGMSPAIAAFAVRTGCKLGGDQFHRAARARMRSAPAWRSRTVSGAAADSDAMDERS